MQVIVSSLLAAFFLPGGGLVALPDHDCLFARSCCSSHSNCAHLSVPRPSRCCSSRNVKKRKKQKGSAWQQSLQHSFVLDANKTVDRQRREHTAIAPCPCNGCQDNPECNRPLLCAVRCCFLTIGTKHWPQLLSVSSMTHSGKVNATMVANA
uniref:Putative secreted protein n=1 Tax=Amblyomma parvum TaxID=251391 RepID=A0A023G2R6_AMBPA